MRRTPRETRALPRAGRAAALCAALAVAALGAVGAWRVERASGALVGARAAAGRGELADAAATLRDAASAVPGNADVWDALSGIEVARAAWYDAPDALDLAVAASRRAATADPRSSDRWLALGSLALRAGRVAEAADAIDRALALDPDRRETIARQADVLEAQGDAKGAARARHRLDALGGDGGAP